MWDIHMHSYFSGDSDANPEEMILSAINKGLEGICFTDHHDIDYPKEPDEPDFLIDFTRYFKELNALGEKYEGRIKVGIGIELGLQPHIFKENKMVMTENNFDMCIGSVHVVEKKDPYYGSFYDGRSEEDAFRSYFEDTIKNLKTFNDFDVLGHIGYLVRYAPNRSKNYHPEHFSDMIDEILRFIIDHGKGIECNTSGYRGGLENPIPSRWILERYFRLGGKIITLGADAHKPEDVAADFSAAASLLKDIGFKYYTVFEKRKPVFLPL